MKIIKTTYSKMRSLLLLLLMIQRHACLKDVMLHMPVAVRAGDSLSMTCDFTLEQENLYSIRFYKGEIELYRFMPEESPPIRLYPTRGFFVDLSRSNMTTITLRNAHRAMTGVYSCEVTADAPFFHTVIKKSFVTVTEEPWALPVITTEKHKYSFGEKINANCTSQGGYPSANLTWYINGQQIGHSPPVNVFYENGPTAVLQLEIHASPQLFQEGRLRLRCEAMQFSLYQRSAQLDLLEDKPHLAPIVGPEAHQESSAGIKLSTRRILYIVSVILTMTQTLANQSGSA